MGKGGSSPALLSRSTSGEPVAHLRKVLLEKSEKKPYPNTSVHAICGSPCVVCRRCEWCLPRSPHRLKVTRADSGVEYFSAGLKGKEDLPLHVIMGQGQVEGGGNLESCYSELTPAPAALLFKKQDRTVVIRMHKDDRLWQRLYTSSTYIHTFSPLQLPPALEKAMGSMMRGRAPPSGHGRTPGVWQCCTLL